MDNNERIVKGIWFPIEIWEADDLDWNEKILLLEIDSFTSKGMDCYMSNEHIAKLLKVSETKAGQMVNDLIKKGYVIKTKFDGRRRFIESNLIGCLADFTKQTRRFCEADTQKIRSNYNKINNCSTNNQTNNKPIRFDFYKSLLSIGVNEQTAKDWMQVRKEKRAANTETAFRRIQQEIAKTGLTAEECIRLSAENSWQGFKAEWLQNKQKQAAPQKQESAYEHNRRLLRELMGEGYNDGGFIDEQ
jgi:DNA-binding MarR family transcriptional regulator